MLCSLEPPTRAKEGARVEKDPLSCVPASFLINIIAQRHFKEAEHATVFSNLPPTPSGARAHDKMKI